MLCSDEHEINFFYTLKALSLSSQCTNMVWQVCLFNFLLYIHSKQLRSCWDDQLLNHTVPGHSVGKPHGGSLPVFSAHSFTSNWQLALLESEEE